MLIRPDFGKQIPSFGVEPISAKGIFHGSDAIKNVKKF
jgi:hypothetical protein